MRDDPFDPSTIDAAEVALRLGTDLARGLTSRDAAQRLACEGRNELALAPPVPRWCRVLAQLRDPLVYLLLVAVVISLVAWASEGAHGWPIDAIVIAADPLLTDASIECSSADHAIVMPRSGAPPNIPAQEKS